MPKRRIESSPVGPEAEREMSFAPSKRGPPRSTGSSTMNNNHDQQNNYHPAFQSPPPPPTKRLRTPLNFSIESLMAPSQHQIITSNRHHSSPQALNVSRSPSPVGSDAGSSASGTSTSTLDSERVQYSMSRQQQHLTSHQSNGLRDTLECLAASSGSSRSSSRVSSPISPGCHLARGHLTASATNNTVHHRHQHSPNSHLNQSGQRHRSASSQPASLAASNTHQRAGTSSGANAASSSDGASPASTGRLNQVECVLDNKDMWDKFHSLNTEMIITKTGRRMFPVLKVQFHNLDPTARYAVSMDIVPVDNKRYRYAYHKSCWQVAGKADPSAEPRLYPHPDSPFNGDLLSRQVISFEKVKLTNNEMDKSGHIILNSMHKYQPRVHLIELKSTLPPPPPPPQQSPLQQLPSLNGSSKLSAASSPGSSRYNNQQQQQPKPQPQLDIEGYRTFVFPETVFTAVTAYQNQLITKMKIDKNPFAKGFRDSSRLSDLDRNDPFDYMSSLGPAAAAAAACAAGRFPGGPGGAGGPLGMSIGSLEAAAAAAGLPPTSTSHQGQMDQAYSQLLASAAAANSPWYSAAAAAANPFGAMGAACSTAQAAQLQATQLWLAAALSSAFQNGSAQQAQSLQPPSAAGGLLPPPGGPTPNHSESPLGPTTSVFQQECRGGSRNSG